MFRSTRIHPRPNTLLVCRALIVLLLAVAVVPPGQASSAISEPSTASTSVAQPGWGEWFAGFFQEPEYQDETDDSPGVVEKLESEPVADIQLCPNSLSLYVGEISTLMPVGLSVDGKVVDGVDATFSSDNTSVADVTSWGEVGALAAGTANITVTMETVSVQVAVSVDSGFRAPVDDATSDAQRAALCPDSSPSGEIVPPDGDTLEAYVQDVTLEENEVGAPPNAAVESAAGSVSKAGGNYGSSSFSFAAPVLSLPGRESSVDLALIYNSQVWEKDTKSGTAKMNFNYGRGWPAAGWRLGYGRIIENFDGSLTGNGSGDSIVNSPGNALLIEADGTRTELMQSYTNGAWKHESVDGRLLRYNFSNGKLKYPNGTIVTYEVKNNRRLPTVIQSPNGNITRISYMAKTATFSTRWAIASIQDTLLRTVTFEYDNAGALLRIKAPGYNGTTRTLVELGYDQTFQLKHNFSIPRDDAPANNTQVTVLRRIYFPTTGTGYVFPDYSTYGIIRKVSQRINMTAVSDGTEVAYSFYNYPADNTGAAIGGPPRYTQRQEWWQGLVNDSPEAGGDTNAPVTYTYASSTAGTIKTHTVTHPTDAKTGDKLIEVTTVDTAAGIFKGKHSTTTLWKNVVGGTRMAKVEYGYSTSGGGAQRSSIKWTNEANQISHRITTFDSSIPSYGRVKQVEEQDGSTTIRKTMYDYADAAASGGDYLSTNQNTGNFFHLVSRIRVFDPTTLIAKTEFEYDNYALNSSDNGALPYEMLTYGTPAPGLTRNSLFDTVTSGIPGVTQRGHVTKVTRYPVVNDAGIARRSKYDIHGNAVRMQVGCCNLKRYTYAGGATGSTGLYFSTVQTETEGPDGGPNLASSYLYDTGTSVVTRVTDAKNHAVNYSYDSTLRLISTSEASQDGASSTPTTTSYAYNINPATGTEAAGDQLSFRERVTYQDNGVSKTQESMRWLDGAGRVIRSGQRATSEGNVFDAAQVTYDIFGRPAAQSNPYRSTSVDGIGAPVGWTVNTYDVLSRAYLVTLQDGQTVLTEFASGRTVSVTDQVGRRRTGTVDALGRTTQVLEDTKVGGASWRTDYVYDKIDNLLFVRMYAPGNTGFQERSAHYDALGRMIDRTTPEGGMETFTYVPDNEMSLIDVHTDARGSSTDYDYDGLNRVSLIRYTASAGVSDPPNVTIGYSMSGTDNGEITSVNSGAASNETYVYDSLGLGRVMSRTVTIDSRSYPLSYTYNGLGQAATMTYPSGRQVRTGFDPRGRLSSVAKINAGTVTYLSGTTFNPAQQITGYTLGNGVAETFNYSETLRQQLTGQTATKSGRKLVDLHYNYAATAAGGGGNKPGNSGQLMAMSGTVNGAAADQTFSYDGVGRLLTATGLGYGQGTNATTIGLYQTTSGGHFLRNSNSSGVADLTFVYGSGGTTVLPLNGDWDGDGDDTVGIYDTSSGAFYLKNSNAGGTADITFIFGAGGANILPVSGDWNGDGVDSIGLYNTTTGVFFLKNSNSSGFDDVAFAFGGGGAGVLPLAGDWDGDGIDTIGIYKTANGEFHLKNTNAGGVSDIAFIYGTGGAAVLPISGDWNGDGADTIGIYRMTNGEFHLKNTNAGGAADVSFIYGAGGTNVLPVTGNWDGASTPGAGFARKYEYDRWGNRKKLWTNVAGTGSPRQTVNLAGGTIPTNRITSVVDGGTQGYAYDLAGNVTNDGQAFAYDAASRIVSVDGSVATYGYDVANQRTRRTTGGSTTHYIWDGSQVIGEYNGATGAALVEYIYAGGKMIARDAAGVVSYYHGDRLTTRVLTNTSGVAVWSGSHDPYGEDVAGSGSATNKHRFTSYERDGESGTDYAVNRQYSFGVGRFMRPDPVAGVLEDPQSLNRFAYARNEPTNFTDQLGLAPDPFLGWRPHQIASGEAARSLYNDCVRRVRQDYDDQMAGALRKYNSNYISPSHKGLITGSETIGTAILAGTMARNIAGLGTLTASGAGLSAGTNELAKKPMKYVIEYEYVKQGYHYDKMYIQSEYEKGLTDCSSRFIEYKLKPGGKFGQFKDYQRVYRTDIFGYTPRLSFSNAANVAFAHLNWLVVGLSRGFGYFDWSTAVYGDAE